MSMNGVLTGGSEIEQAFKIKNEQGKPAFIPFIVAGYPSFETTIDIALALQEAGADILELGIPYSDPLADGPVIQEASKEALKQGMSLTKGVELIQQLRERGLKIPIIPFCYYNPILQFGLEAFIQEAKRVGANGVLVPDLPFEESQELSAISRQYGMACISLLAPTSEQRIQRILKQAQGFVYCISSLGVTGIRDRFDQNIEEFLKSVKSLSPIPVAVGFGVSKKEHVQYLQPFVDGIIIGSAIVKLTIEYKAHFLEEGKRQEALAAIKKFVQLCFSE